MNWIIIEAFLSLTHFPPLLTWLESSIGVHAHRYLARIVSGISLTVKWVCYVRKNAEMRRCWKLSGTSSRSLSGFVAQNVWSVFRFSRSIQQFWKQQFPSNKLRWKQSKFGTEWLKIIVAPAAERQKVDDVFVALAVCLFNISLISIQWFMNNFLDIYLPFGANMIQYVHHN